MANKRVDLLDGVYVQTVVTKKLRKHQEEGTFKSTIEDCGMAWVFYTWHSHWSAYCLGGRFEGFSDRAFDTSLFSVSVEVLRLMLRTSTEQLLFRLPPILRVAPAKSRAPKKSDFVGISSLGALPPVARRGWLRHRPYNCLTPPTSSSS